jgi:hypothetical protein
MALAFSLFLWMEGHYGFSSCLSVVLQHCWLLRSLDLYKGISDAGQLEGPREGFEEGLIAPRHCETETPTIYSAFFTVARRLHGRGES